MKHNHTLFKRVQKCTSRIGGLREKRRLLQKRPVVKKTVLTGIALVSIPFVTRAWNQEKTPGICFDTDYLQAGTPVHIQLSGMEASQVDSCIWFVGDVPVSSSQKLTSYIPKEADAEQFLSVTVTLTDGSSYSDSLYYSVLPILYLEGSTPYDEITKDKDTKVSMRLTAGSEFTPREEYEGEASIHVRGNSTSTLQKLPFKLKLEQRTDLLGLGSGKHWCLLANAIDSTLLRNKLLYDFSRDIGADTSMASQHVTLFYNGEYYGVYQLCQQVRADENSVDIYQWEQLAENAAADLSLDLVRRELLPEAAAPKIQEAMKKELSENLAWLDTQVFSFSCLKSWNETHGTSLPVSMDLSAFVDYTQLPAATGGILLEMDFFFEEDEEVPLLTNYHLPFHFSRPVYGETYESLYDYTKEYLQALEYAFHDTDFTFHNASPHYKVADEGWFDWGYEWKRLDVAYEPWEFSSQLYDGCHYSQLADFDSLLMNFLVCEYSMNWDSMKNSFFVYKDLDGPLYAGPVWDFDWAWGNGMFTVDTWYPEGWLTTSDYFASETYYQTVQWNRYLIRDPYFLVRTYEKYWEIREPVIENMVRDGGLIDQYADSLRPAAMANDERWGGSMGNFEGQTFEEGVVSLKSFLQQRIQWLDAQFASVETLRCSLGYYPISSQIVVENVDTDSHRDYAELTVSADLKNCTALSFQVNGIHFFQADLEDGRAVIQIPAEALIHASKGSNVVQIRALDASGAYLINPEGTIAGDYENAYSNYVYFEKTLFKKGKDRS